MNLKSLALIGATLFSPPFSAFAQDDLGYQSHEEIKVGYEKFLRLNSPQNKTKNSDWLDFGYQYEMKNNSLNAKFDTDLRLYLNTQNFSPSLKEAYIEYESIEGSRYALGRKKIDWNPNEAFWQLNHIQNTQGFRLMDTNTEGLSGFHYSFNDNLLNIDILLSYFSIPSLNPSVSIEDGAVSSNVDWYKLPPKKTIISGNEVDIYYTLNTPEYRDIVIQKSLGLRMGTDFTIAEGVDAQVNAFSLYKPERTLRVNAEAYYDPSLDKVAVNANPVVNHHMIFGGDYRMYSKNWNLVTGLVHVDPNARLGSDFDSLSLSLENNRTLSSEFFKVEPHYIRETYAHFQYGHKWEEFKLSFNSIYYFSKHPESSDDFYSETVKWVRAVGVAGQLQINDWSQATAMIRYDYKRKDNLLSAQYILNLWRSSVLTFGAELIKSPKTSSYWSAYRTNDTFYFNAAYIF